MNTDRLKMARISSIDFTQYNKIPQKKNYNDKKLLLQEKYNQAQINFGRNKSNSKPITLNEGLSLLGKGIKQQCRDTIKSLFTWNGLFGMMGVSLGLSLLPLIGIPISVGGGVLAIGFGIASTAGAVKHSLEFVKNNKAGRYNLARKNLRTMGEDSVNLALSLPFTPTSVLKIKDFAKFGKIGKNSNVFNNVSITKTVETLFKNADVDLERNLSFRKNAQKELNTIKNLSQKELKIFAEILEKYNVPFDKIPEVVLRQWAAEHNIFTTPRLGFSTLNKTTSGVALGNECMIVLNDYKTVKTAVSKYDIVKVKLVGDTYHYTYRDNTNGKLLVEKISKKIIDDYTELQRKTELLSPELKRIMTTIHEREHIDQYARMIMAKGMNFLHPSSSAKDIYNAMIKEISAQKTSPEKAQEIANIIAKHFEKDSGTGISYLQRPQEIGARKAEAQAIDRPLYVHLNNIYKKVNAQNPKSKIDSTTILTTTRVFSQAS